MPFPSLLGENLRKLTPSILDQSATCGYLPTIPSLPASETNHLTIDKPVNSFLIVLGRSATYRTYH